MSFAVAPSFEVAPRAMSHDRNRIEIVHAGAAKSSVGRREAGRLDDMGLDCETSTEPQNRSGILRNVGFVESDTHGLDGTNAGGHLGRPKLPFGLPAGYPARSWACRARLRDVSMARLHSLGKGANKTRRIASLLISPRSDETGLPPRRLVLRGRFAARME